MVFAGLSLGAPRPARATPASFHPSAGSTLVVLTATNGLNFVSASPSVTTLQVEFEIENVASTDHTFTLSSRVDQTAPPGTDPSSSASGSWFDPAHLLADVPIAPGHTAFMNVTLPSVGSYQFICRYHFPGMVGTVTVGPASSSDSSSMPLYLYGGIAIAVLIALVVVVLLLRRSRSRTPPPVAEAPK